MKDMKIFDVALIKNTNRPQPPDTLVINQNHVIVSYLLIWSNPYGTATNMPLALIAITHLFSLKWWPGMDLHHHYERFAAVLTATTQPYGFL